MLRIVLRQLLFSLFCCVPALAPAQENRVSAKQVEMETRFIDANRERILGNYDKAIPMYEEILKEDQENHAAAYELARIYSIQEAYDKSVHYAENAMEMDPSNTWYKEFLAEVYQKAGNYREAAALYQELVRQHPDNAAYYYEWAFQLVRANEIQEAVRVYDQLERRIGVTEELIRRKHALYMGTGDVRRAGRELERLIEAFPGNVEYQYLMAAFYQETGQADKADEVYRYILQLDPGEAKARLALAGEAPSGSNELQYLNSLRPIFQDPGVDIDLKVKKLLPIIRQVADTGDRDLGEAALPLTLLLEEQHPGEAKAYAASADLLYYLGRRREAIAKYEKTLQLDDTVFSVWEQLLYAYREEGDYEQLLETAEEAMDYFPNQAVAYWLYGVAAHELGKDREALSALDQALLMSGSDERMTFNVQAQLGSVYGALGQAGRSDAAFEAALRLNPKAAVVLNDYSLSLAQRGVDLEKALRLAETAHSLDPERAAFQHTCGWVHYKMKNYAQAKSWIGKALANGGDQPLTLEHYGDVLFQLADEEGALQYWLRAQEKGGGSKLLDKKITDKQLYE